MNTTERIADFLRTTERWKWAATKVVETERTLLGNIDVKFVDRVCLASVELGYKAAAHKNPETYESVMEECAKALPIDLPFIEYVEQFTAA